MPSSNLIMPLSVIHHFPDSKFPCYHPHFCNSLLYDVSEVASFLRLSPYSATSPKTKPKIPLTGKQSLCHVSLDSPPSFHTLSSSFFCRLLCFVLPLEVIGNVVKWLKTWALESESQKWILQITDTQILRMLSYLSERDFIVCKVGMTMLLHLENCWESYVRQRIYKTYILLDYTWPLGGFTVIVSSCYCYDNFVRLPPFFHSYPLPPTHPLIWPYMHTQTRSFLTSVSVPFQYLLN